MTFTSTFLIPMQVLSNPLHHNSDEFHHRGGRGLRTQCQCKDSKQWTEPKISYMQFRLLLAPVLTPAPWDFQLLFWPIGGNSDCSEKNGRKVKSSCSFRSLLAMAWKWLFLFWGLQVHLGQFFLQLSSFSLVSYKRISFPDKSTLLYPRWISLFLPISLKKSLYQTVSNYLIWLCHLLPVKTLLDIISNLKCKLYHSI